ncbi:hypothetical protein [Halopelagius longus]|uniref:Uncharacterized protein n=1 Tax=Halopelagius longus TaxID=1236180 RepID=A0A1H1FHS6_9EURY|nr:hypothetical protein [Halopelagius longus]RDI70100.1 hypothetical protein DWB78_15855 [Halopelagius longus]SDR00384.1 hypothetical protein SAMN05216278_3215 [Halopelagius longus]
MAFGERISFVTTGDDADERLIREYVVPAVDRLEAIDDCTGVRFSRFGMDPRYDRSEVMLGIYGDFETVIRSERDRWDALVEDGYAESWSREGPPFADKSEPVQRFLGRAYVLGSGMACEYFDRFEDRPELVEEVADDDGRRYGLWCAFHVLANNMGYRAEEEVDAYERLLRDRLVSLTELRDYDFVRDRIEDVRTELDELECTVDELEERGGFDYYSGPNRR